MDSLLNDGLSATWFVFALFGAYGLGSLTGSKRVAERVFIGLGVNAALLVPIQFVAPSMVVHVATLITIFGFFILIARRLKSAPHRPKTLLETLRLFPASHSVVRHLAEVLTLNRATFFSAAASFALTFWLYPTWYIFENHDLIYFGWLPSLLNNGTMSVDFSVPLTMGATNSLSSLFLAPLASPFHQITFLDIMLTRALFVNLFVFLIIRRLASGQPSQEVWLLTLSIGAALIIWGPEWSYTMMISSFVPAIGLALVALSMIHKEWSKDEIFWLFTIVGLSKAPIVAVSILTLMFLVFSRRWRPKWYTVLASGTLGVLSLMTWLLAPRGAINYETTFSVFGIWVEREPSFTITLRAYDFAASFAALGGWIADYPTKLINVGLPDWDFPVQVAFIAFSIVWMLVKYFLVYGVVRAKYERQVFPLDIWVLGSAVSILVVRNGQDLVLSHQAHAFVLTAIPTSLLAVSYWCNIWNSGSDGKVKRRLQTTISRVSLAAIVLSLGFGAGTSNWYFRQQSDSAISLQEAQASFEILQLSEDNFIVGSSLPYEKLQVIASLSGSKLENRNPAEVSIVDVFLIPKRD